ncbi:unnamed protein product [Sympodiomycopsis kandeliae]
MDLGNHSGAGDSGKTSTATGSAKGSSESSNSSPRGARRGISSRGRISTGAVRGATRGVRGVRGGVAPSSRGMATSSRGGLAASRGGLVPRNKTLNNVKPTTASTSTSQPSSSSSTSASSSTPAAPTFSNKTALFSTSTAPAPDQPSQSAFTGPPSQSALAGPSSSSSSLSSGGQFAPQPQPKPKPYHPPSGSSSPAHLQPPPSSSSSSTFGDDPPLANTLLGSGSASEDDAVADAARKTRFTPQPSSETSNKWLAMKAQRPALRQKYIDDGLLPDPDKPQDLSQATRFVGTCTDMCPEYERQEREFQGEGDELEVYTGTTKLDPSLAVKIYRRPAAGREVPLPDDVRPPIVLKKTLDYLFHNLMPSSPTSAQFANVQGFLWNRTRAVRQDFIVQGQGDLLTIECHERIARWHILSLHWRGGSVDSQGEQRNDWPKDRDPWSEQQELEQLAKTLTSLNEFYDDLRINTGQSNPAPNEAEFRAYHLILNLYDPEVLRSVELLPMEVFDCEILQTAIQLRSYVQRSNRQGPLRETILNTDSPMNFFSLFFKTIHTSSSVTYLLACILESKFASIRKGALKALCSNYNKVHKGPTSHFIQTVLGADSTVQVIQWASTLGIEVQMENDHSISSLKLHNKVDFSNPKAVLSNVFSVSIVEGKRGNWTTQDIVDGKASGASPLLQSEGKVRVLPASKTSVSSSTSSIGKPSIPASTSGMSPLAMSFEPTQPQPQLQLQQQQQQQQQQHIPTSHAPFESAATTAATQPSTFGTKTSAFSTSSVQPSSSPFGKGTPAAEGASAFASSSSGSSMVGTKPSAFSASSGPSSSPFGARSSAFTSSSPSGPFFGFSSSSSSNPPSSSPFTTKPSAFSSSPSSASTTKDEASATSLFPSSKALPSSQPLPKQQEQQPVPDITAPGPTSTASVAPKPAAAARRRPSYTITSESECRSNYLALVRWHATKIAKEAIRREHQRRRQQARDYFIDVIAKRIYATLSQEYLTTGGTTDIACSALADEYRRRVLLDTSFEKWQITLARNLESQKQRDRLEEIRKEVKRRGLSSSSSLVKHTRRDNLGSSLDGDDSLLDSQLSASINAGNTQRASLWTRGSFSVSIASHLLDLVSRFRPSGMTTWCAHVSVSSTEDTASSWLMRKFDLERPGDEHDDDSQMDLDELEGSHLQQKVIPITPQVDVRIKLAQQGEAVQDKGSSSDTGLVIFCMSPDQQNTKEWWQKESARMAELQKRQDVAQSRFAIRLLIISWTASSPDLLDRLQVSPGIWKGISILNLGTANPDLQFKSALETLVKDVSYTSKESHPRSTQLQDLVLLVRKPWSEAVSQTDILLQRLARYIKVARAHNLSLGNDLTNRVQASVKQTFLTLLALCNYGLNVVIESSETLYEVDSDDRLQLVTTLNADSDNGREDPMSELYSLGSQLISSLIDSSSSSTEVDFEDHHQDTSQLLLLRSNLYHTKSNAFPLSMFLETIYTHLVNGIELQWLHSSANPDILSKETKRIGEWSRKVVVEFNTVVSLVGKRIRELQHQHSAHLSRSTSSSSSTTSSLKRKDSSDFDSTTFGVKRKAVFPTGSAPIGNFSF